MIESIYFMLKGTFLQKIYKVLRISVPIYLCILKLTLNDWRDYLCHS